MHKNIIFDLMSFCQIVSTIQQSFIKYYKHAFCFTKQNLGSILKMKNIRNINSISALKEMKNKLIALELYKVVAGVKQRV